MHNYGHPDFCGVEESRHLGRRHVDTAMTAVGFPYASAEGVSPIGIVEPLAAPGDTQPVLYGAGIF